MPYLNSEQLEHFNSKGYLIINGFWESSTVDQLEERMGYILQSFDYDSVNTIFTTDEQCRKTDDYFLESGNKIRFFWEEKAWDENGKLVSKPSECINKVGHALHDLDERFAKVSYDPRIYELCRELGLEVSCLRYLIFVGNER